MEQLVLAIEPDVRQAAIVKRIVREKVLADVAVVDSRDAALEAMRTSVPDVLLLSALLSPRDEDELVAHLRTLEHAQHLQTHTIPQLASSIGHDDGEKPRGLLSAFRRKKGAGAAPSGCDPELFADEVRTYLQRASEKKRELREAAALGNTVPAAPRMTPAAAAAPVVTEEADAAAGGSSWSSPFEWRPTRSGGSGARTTGDETRAEAPAAAPAIVEPAPVQAGASSIVEPEPAAATPDPILAAPEPFIEPATVPAAVAAEPDPIVEPEPVMAAVMAEPEPVVLTPDPVLTIPEPVLAWEEPVRVAAEPPALVRRHKLPLVTRHAREWWFEDESRPRATDTDSELREVLASLTVPLDVATIGYAEGCRIRRVRLQAN